MHMYIYKYSDFPYSGFNIYIYTYIHIPCENDLFLRFEYEAPSAPSAPTKLIWSREIKSSTDRSPSFGTGTNLFQHLLPYHFDGTFISRLKCHMHTWTVVYSITSQKIASSWYLPGIIEGFFSLKTPPCQELLTIGLLEVMICKLQNSPRWRSVKPPKMATMTSWWLNQPIWKIWYSQIGSWNPPFSGWKFPKKKELPPT